MKLNRCRTSFVLIASAFILLLQPGCSSMTGEEADRSVLAREELAAFNSKVTDDYIRFEKAQEPSKENGFTYREYYQHLFDPTLNPRTLAIPWLEEFELRHRGTPAGLEALDTILGYLGYSRRLAHEKAPACYDLLLEFYIGLESLGDICYHGPLCEKQEDYLAVMDRLLAGSLFRSVKAKAVVSKMLVYRRMKLAEEERRCGALLIETYPDVLYKNTPCRDIAAEYRLPRHPESTLRIGSKAPAFSGYDVDGSPVSLGDFEGEIVVIVFFGFW